VERVEGEAGDFRVALVKKPRYIILDQCTGCTTCVEYCPVTIPDPFNQGLSRNKAIHLHYSQAVPLIAYIDENCLYLKEKKCGICAGVCEKKAIDFTQTPERVEVKVGAIVLAAGYDLSYAVAVDEFGYQRLANVVTSLDFERLTCATGPYEGEIRRPSDRRHPKKIAWIQCVGSRQVTEEGNSYCSAVCCTYTQKQVILAKEHDPEVEAVIFHNDIRSYGKDFERFYRRAAGLPGVRFVRSYASIGREIPETKNVTVRYSTPQDGVREEEFELVVLSLGLNPPVQARELAEKFGIELEPHGFCRTNPLNPVETTRPGIYVSGAFCGPADIPEAVFSASAAGSRCGELLGRRRGKLAREKQYPPEKDVSQEEPRIGVFVCYCGANIGRVVDVPAVTEYASTLPGVVYAQQQLFSCASNSTKEIADAIKEKGLNRVVVAACTPRTHEPTFRSTLREAGLNQYYFEMANIREHCSWVHPREKEAATEKAKDLVRMAVARARMLEALQDLELPVTKVALVVGGGVAGMTAALSIADQGFEVHLVEKQEELGGTARRLHYTLEGVDVQAFLRELTGKVKRHPRIRVYTGAEILEVTGYIGNFLTRVRCADEVAEINHGVAVIAIGAEEYKPDEYLYGKDDRVLTLLELEERIAGKDEKVARCQSLVMIQCVGCRQEDRNYCSRVCCSHAVKNALKLKEINPEADVCVLFRDMRTYGLREDYYRAAADKEVKFIRYDPENKPEVEPAEAEEDGREILRVTVTDAVLGRRVAIEADLVALAAAVVPAADTGRVAQLFQLPLNEDGFFKEIHVKLRPVEFSTDGVFLCGSAHYPKHLPEVIGQAYGAAGRAVNILARDFVTTSGAVAEVTEKRCMGCGACAAACTYGAIELYEARGGRRARVNPFLCKGDGLCNAKCPTGAIALKHYTDRALASLVDAFGAEPEPAASKAAAG